MTSKQFTALLVLSALWGGSFLFIRVAAPALGPVMLVELRVLIAGIALLIYASLSRHLPELRSRWKTFLVIGLFNSAVPFFLISTAELHLTASLAATLNAATPLFGALVAAFWLGETITPRKALGLLLGLVGVAVLVGLGPVPLTPVVLLSIGASLLATVSYGFAAVYTKVAAKGVPPLALALYSQLFAATLIAPVVPFALPTTPPSGLVVLCVLGLALFSTALAYLLYFYLIVSAGPTKATTVTYLSPAFGILWGVFLLAEPLTLGSLLGFGIILASVWLVTGQPTPRVRVEV
ncbi:MAG: DMT family transporter [Thermaceae bacterium]|nr:DMT family transporter [Thermaceae bacterium]